MRFAKVVFIVAGFIAAFLKTPPRRKRREV
jgi:hypothetical protein